MRLMRLGPQGHEIPVAAAAGRYWDLRSLTADIGPAFFAAQGCEQVVAAVRLGQLEELQDADKLRVGAPITAPSKIVCIGLNYRDHAEETRAAIPSEPIVFMKDPGTIVGPNDPVLIPRRSVKTDWEVELGVIIGREARYLDSAESAAVSIAGYVLSHDVSEREFQIERGGQWDKGKSCESFNPLGPFLATPDEIADPQSLRLRLWVNNDLKQDSSTANMIFGVHDLIWYLSQYMVLRPGDLINTGTPAGVALGSPEPKPYLRPGDIVELAIDGLGVATHTFTQA